MGCFGFRIFRTEPGTGPWDRLERRKYSRSDNSVEKNMIDRGFASGTGDPSVPRLRRNETKKQESFRLRIENPITPSPPSLRSFLLSVVSSRSAACRRATTTAGRGRRRRQDHDHQYDVHHIVLVRLVILFSRFLSFVSIISVDAEKEIFLFRFVLDEYATWASDCFYLTTTTTTRRRRNTNKRAVALLNSACFLLLFLNLLWLTSFL